MDFNIHGNTALLTASSKGLGKASAKALLEEGVNVVLNGRDETTLNKAVAELETIGGGEVVGYSGDMTKKTAAEDLVEFSVSEFGGIDHLVTSAGGPPGKPFEDTTEEDWYYWFDMLVMSVVRVIRRAIPYLRESKHGTIINITSLSVKEAAVPLVLSNSIRMAVIGLEKTLSKELAPEIRVNSVLPGTYETDRFKNRIEHAVEQDEYNSYSEGVKKFLKRTGVSYSLDRLGDPKELGDVVAFLSSERSSFINGTSILIDGGAHRSNL